MQLDTHQIFEAFIQRKAKDLGFADCFTSRTRQKVFEKELNTKCRNVKHQFRGHVCKFRSFALLIDYFLKIKSLTFGSKRVGLEQFYLGMSKKYLNTAKHKLEEGHRIRLLILVSSYSSI